VGGRRGGLDPTCVDLDAAFDGKSRNLEVIREIAAAVSVPCELGGGMRDAASIEAGLSTGVRRVIIGTKAAEPGFSTRRREPSVPHVSPSGSTPRTASWP